MDKNISGKRWLCRTIGKTKKRPIFLTKICLCQLAYFICTAILIIVGLELILRLRHVPAYIIPLPSQVLITFVQAQGFLLTHALVTLKGVVIGFACGCLSGILLAILFFYAPALERGLLPLICSLQIFPKIALVPLLIIWLGFGTMPKIVISALLSLFPVMLSTLKGFRSIPVCQVDLFNSLFASEWAIFFKLRLPGASPLLFLGFKNAILLATMGVIVVEFLSASEGLGFLVQISSSQINLSLCFVSTIALGTIVILLYGIIELAERYFLYWQYIGSSYSDTWGQQER